MTTIYPMSQICWRSPQHYTTVHNSYRHSPLINLCYLFSFWRVLLARRVSWRINNISKMGEYRFFDYNDEDSGSLCYTHPYLRHSVIFWRYSGAIWLSFLACVFAWYVGIKVCTRHFTYVCMQARGGYVCYTPTQIAGYHTFINLVK